MLDHFMQTLYERDARNTQLDKLAHDLKRLPDEALQKLANGEVKLAFDRCDDWLEKFKGTALFEEALALERAEIENEAAQQQARALTPPMDMFYQTSDQIRLQKRMLDLELAEMPAQEAPPPPEVVPAAAPTEKAAAAPRVFRRDFMQKATGFGRAKQLLQGGHLADLRAERLLLQQAVTKPSLDGINRAIKSERGKVLATRAGATAGAVGVVGGLGSAVTEKQASVQFHAALKALRNARP